MELLAEGILCGFTLAYVFVNLLPVRQIKCDRTIDLLVIKPKRLRDRLRAMPFPVCLDEGVERHAGVRNVVDAITVFDIGFVHGVLHALFDGGRNCTRSCGGEPAVPTSTPALTQHQSLLRGMQRDHTVN